MSEGPVMDPRVAATPPGWYGKLPALGDFASRRLPKPLVERIDAWLQAGIEASRNELGEPWLAVYLHAPIQRFWIAPGVSEARAWSGVLMPSVDRVGRHFPLLIASEIGAADRFAADHLPDPDWFRSLEDVAVAALDLNATLEDLESRLAGLGGPPVGALLPDARNDALVASVIAARPGPGPASVWWVEHSDGSISARAFDALPPPGEFARLLEGWPAGS